MAWCGRGDLRTSLPKFPQPESKFGKSQNLVKLVSLINHSFPLYNKLPLRTTKEEEITSPARASAGSTSGRGGGPTSGGNSEGLVPDQQGLHHLQDGFLAGGNSHWERGECSQVPLRDSRRGEGPWGPKPETLRVARGPYFLTFLPHSGQKSASGESLELQRGQCLSAEPELTSATRFPSRRVSPRRSLQSVLLKG